MWPQLHQPVPPKHDRRYPAGAKSGNPNYLKVLLDGQSTLEERFAQIQVDTVRKELRDALNPLEKVPSEIRQLIHVQTFPETICHLFRKVA